MDKKTENTSTYCFCIKFNDGTIEFVYGKYYFINGGLLVTIEDEEQAVFICKLDDVQYIKRLGDKLNPEELLQYE